MNENEITSPEELDAVLARRAMSRREKLWRAAEGRSYRWVDLLGAALGALAIVNSLYQGFFDRGDAIVSVVVGLTLIGSATYRHQQSQISALRELLELETRRAETHRRGA